MPELTKRCLGMALAEGISGADFQAEVDELEAFIAAKLEDANNAEKERPTP